MREAGGLSGDGPGTNGLDAANVVPHARCRRLTRLCNTGAPEARHPVSRSRGTFRDSIARMVCGTAGRGRAGANRDERARQSRYRNRHWTGAGVGGFTRSKDGRVLWPGRTVTDGYYHSYRRFPRSNAQELALASQSDGQARTRPGRSSFSNDLGDASYERRGSGPRSDSGVPRSQVPHHGRQDAVTERETRKRPPAEHYQGQDALPPDAGCKAGCVTVTSIQTETAYSPGAPTVTTANGARMVMTPALVQIEPPSTAPVSIDPRSSGMTAVAILSTAMLAASDIDPASVRFGPKHAINVTPASLQDLDHDGRPDLVLHFRLRDTGLACSDSSAPLTGQTLAGQVFAGSEAIVAVGCK